MQNFTPCLTRSVVKHIYYNVFGHPQNLECSAFCDEIRIRNACKKIQVLSHMMKIPSKTSRELENSLTNAKENQK